MYIFIYLFYLLIYKVDINCSLTYKILLTKYFYNTSITLHFYKK